jgi:putative hydrolase of the HAD superfamily
VFARVLREHEEMEVRIPPDPTPGIGDALAALSVNYPMAVVSDTIVSPARCLKQWLSDQQMLQFFTGFAFSDEVGHSKPHRDMFASAAEQLGVDISEMVHIGDRDHNDIKGAHTLGMKAVLYTGTRDQDKAITTADAICRHHSELPAIIDRLAAASDGQSPG